MTDELRTNTDEVPSAKTAVQTPTRAQDVDQLRHRITDLLVQVETLQGFTKAKDIQEDLVSQLRLANQNLVLATFNAQDLQAKAEDANQVKEEFISMLAHELRNPLAPISMATDLIGKIVTAHPQLPKLHGIIRRQVSHLTHLVDDLLDASRMTTGKITLQTRTLLLGDIVESAIEIAQPFIYKRHQQLRLDLPFTPVVIEGDADRLAQVFSNLLLNASKFTPEQGQIQVSAHTTAEAITVTVLDNGVGITRDLQPFIFDLFTQGPHALDRSQGGLGIGLSLVRLIVEMHGGCVNVHSAGTDAGSAFTVRLPRSNTSLPPETVPMNVSATARRSRILLIEDNADSNDTLKTLLTQEGHTVSTALNGITGLAMATNHPYDIIMCDIGLPGMNGYDVVTHLRQQTLQPIPYFIAITGYNQTEKYTSGAAESFDHYLVKPIAIDVLLKQLSSCVPR